jgi:hypothetical protein
VTLHTYQPPPAATSPQEARQLIGFVGETTRRIAEIETDLALDIAALNRAAEAEITPLKTALDNAQGKVEAWARRHPDQARLIGVGDRAVDALDAQTAALLMATGRPVTPRQAMILKALKAGAVLRRADKGKGRTFWLRWPRHVPADQQVIAARFLTTNHVHDLQMRFLDAFDVTTGAPLLGVSAFGDHKVEFRLKPDAVLP